MTIISIGEAARRLALSVDTVRELERAGELRATRTPGGHRRFSLAAIDAYLARGSASVEPRAEELSQPAPDLSWDAPDAVDAQMATPAAADSHADRPSLLEKFARSSDLLAERARLDGLRAHGRARIPSNASARARSAVIETLESYVTSARFPSSTPWWEAHAAIGAKVAAVLEPFTAEAAHAPAPSPTVVTPSADRADYNRRVQALIAHGKSRALLATISWERDDAEEARADVLEALEDEVESNCTESEVNELVDEILGEWEEESEE